MSWLSLSPALPSFSATSTIGFVAKEPEDAAAKTTTTKGFEVHGRKP